MSDAELGIPFDIHGGGVDLVFPHHENEIAQTEAATGKPMAHYWMHGGMLQTSGEKMSKSLGNFLLLHDLLKDYSPNVIRLLMLQTHYRSPLDFSDERLKEAATSLERIQAAIDRATFALDAAHAAKKKRTIARSMFPTAASTELQTATRETITGFQADMDDDFNTAGAAGKLFDLVRSINTFLETKAGSEDTALDEDEAVSLQAAVDTLTELFEVCGVTLRPSSLDTCAETPDLQEAQDLLKQRTAAREAKDWARADEIRDELATLGFEIKDTPQGPQLVKK